MLLAAWRSLSPNPNLNQDYVHWATVLSVNTFPVHFLLVNLELSLNPNAQAAASLAANMVSVHCPTADREVAGAGAGLER